MGGHSRDGREPALSLPKGRPSLHFLTITIDTAGRLDKFGQDCYIAACMSLVVKLEDDLGERSEWILLHAVIPHNKDGSFPLLSGIDPFGKTVFNHLQMREFLREWEKVKDRVRDESQMEAWEKVKHMAETCRDDRDLYLRFVGN